MTKKNGFTLIELLVSIALMIIITASVYFAISSALESWAYCRDTLSLQKVLSESMDKIINGTYKQFGLKDSLEIMEADVDRVEFVPPWVDDTHSVADRNFIYTLNRRLKPGSPLPIGEVRLAESREWRLVPVSNVPLEGVENSQVRIALPMPEGSDMRFIYHPDSKSETDVTHKIMWDKDAKQIMLETGDQKQEISKNLFGVEITDMKLRYYTNGNELVTDRDSVDDTDRDVITAVEISLEAKVNNKTQNLVSFINLRNAPMHTGYLTLRKDMKIPIPDSVHIRTFLITNIMGVSNNDILELEATPKAGKSWRVHIDFERIGFQKPAVKMITVDYPAQHTVLTEYPKTDVDLGVNLLLLGENGLYDYDKDPDVNDPDEVVLEGDVELRVTEMTVKGAGLFVRP